jgi:hypothetical protein
LDPLNARQTVAIGGSWEHSGCIEARKRWVACDHCILRPAIG